MSDEADGAVAATPLEQALQRLLSDSALTAFRLNGQYLSATERLARPAGLTAAWWQVLGAVLAEPLPVAGVARALGTTRQSVQRIADLLVERGLATYEPNPAHRRAKLVTPTAAGREAIARITPGYTEFAARLADELGGEAEFAEVLAAQERLTAALEALERREAAGEEDVETAIGRGG